MGKSNEMNQSHSEIERTNQDNSKEEDFKARKQRKELRLMKMSREWDARRQKRRLDRQKWLEERKTQNLPIWKRVGNLRVQVNDVEGGQIMHHEDDRDAYSDFTESNLNIAVNFGRADRPVSDKGSTTQTALDQVADENTKLGETTNFSSEREAEKKCDLAELPKTLSFVSVKAEPSDETKEKIRGSNKAVTTSATTADTTAETIQEVTAGETAVHQKCDERTSEQTPVVVAVPSNCSPVHTNSSATEWTQICTLSDLQRAVPPVVFEEYIKRQGEVKVHTLDNKCSQQIASDGCQKKTQVSPKSTVNRSQHPCFIKDEDVSRSFPRIKTCYSLTNKSSSDDSIGMLAPSTKGVSSSSRLPMSLDSVPLNTGHNGRHLMNTRVSEIPLAGKESYQKLQYTIPVVKIPNINHCCKPSHLRIMDFPQTISIKQEQQTVEVADSFEEKEPPSSKKTEEVSEDEPKRKKVRLQNPQLLPLLTSKNKDKDAELPVSVNSTETSPVQFMGLRERDNCVTTKTQDNNLGKDSRFSTNLSVCPNERHTGVSSRSAFSINRKTKIQELAELSVQKHLSNAIQSSQNNSRRAQAQRQHKSFVQEHEEQQRRIHRRREEVQQLKKQKEQHHLQRLRREEQQWKKHKEMRQSREQKEHEKEKWDKNQAHEEDSMSGDPKTSSEQKQNHSTSPCFQHHRHHHHELEQNGQKRLCSSQNERLDIEKHKAKQPQQQNQLHSSKIEIIDQNPGEHALHKWHQPAFLGGKSAMIVRNVPHQNTFSMTQQLQKANKSTFNSLEINQTPICSTLSASNVKQDQSGRLVGPEVVFNPMSLYVRSKLVPREIVVPPQVGTSRTPMVEYIKTDMICKEHLTHWTAKNVADFISATDCSEHASIFLEQEIDGKAVLLLTQEMLTKGMSLKLGPAMKLYNHICNLRAALVMNTQSASKK